MFIVRVPTEQLEKPPSIRDGSNTIDWGTEASVADTCDGSEMTTGRASDLAGTSTLLTALYYSVDTRS